MKQWEFNRLVIRGTEKELEKAMQEHPDLVMHTQNRWKLSCEIRQP